MGKQDSRIPVGISSCITGENVRYDGGNKYDSKVIEHLGQHFEFKAFCPEFEAGLGVPREPIHLVYKNKKIRAVVVQNPEHDVTKALKKTAEKNSQLFESLCGYILKSRSPSCGMKHVPVFKGGKQKGESAGVFAQRLMKTYPCLPVEESERLQNSEILENFVVRVFVMKEWQKLMSAEKLTPKKLQSFHDEFQYLALSHRPDTSKQLQRMMKGAKKKGIKDVAKDYITLLMRTLRVKPSIEHQALVMQTVADQLASDSSKEESQKVSKVIEKFSRGNKSRNDVIELLRKLAAQQEQVSPAIERYLTPYPATLVSDFLS